MNKKDYIKFALMIRTIKENPSICNVLEKIQSDMKTIFATDNPNFNAKVFDAACEARND